MVRKYLEQAYLPAAQALKQRVANGAERAKAMAAWEQRVRRNSKSVHTEMPDIAHEGDTWVYMAPVYLGEMDAGDIQVEIYADPAPGDSAQTIKLARSGPIPDAAAASAADAIHRPI
jgi:hypothetical protein